MVASSCRRLFGHGAFSRPREDSTELRGLPVSGFAAASSTKKSTNTGMSSRRSRSGGSTMRKPLRRRIEIGKKKIVGRERREWNVARCDDADVDSHVAIRPDRANLPALDGMQELLWTARDALPISSRKSVPPAAEANRPDAIVARVRKRAGDMAEEFGSGEGIVDRAQDDVLKRSTCARRESVEIPGDMRLASARFALDQYRGSARFRETLRLRDSLQVASTGEFEIL